MRRLHAILCGALFAAICSSAALAAEGVIDHSAKVVPPLVTSNTESTAKTDAPPKPPVTPKPAVPPKPIVPVKPLVPAKPQVMPPQAPLRSRQSFADMVRELVAKGEVRPLKDVLDVVHKTNPGDIVSVKLRHQKPRWVYHVRVVHEGRRTDLDIDGKSLKVLERD